MKPGTYDVTLFQGELEAGAGRVTVSVGQTATVNLSVNLSRPNVIWSIGETSVYNPQCHDCRKLTSDRCRDPRRHAQRVWPLLNIARGQLPDTIP